MRLVATRKKVNSILEKMQNLKIASEGGIRTEDYICFNKSMQFILRCEKNRFKWKP